MPESSCTEELSTTSTNVSPSTSSSKHPRKKHKKQRTRKKKELPTYVGWSLPAKVFTDLTFSLPKISAKYPIDSDYRSYADALRVLPSSRRLPRRMSLISPDYPDVPVASKIVVSDYEIVFFPIRHLRPDEPFNSTTYTLDPTEADRNRLTQFKIWVDVLGGEFDPAQATLLVVPPIHQGQFGYLDHRYRY